MNLSCNNYKHIYIKQQGHEIHEINIDRIDGKNSSTTIVGDVNIPLSIMDGTTIQKINMELEDLNSTKNNQIQ